MALSDYTPAKSAVTFKGITLVEVRGLNLTDMTTLMRNHIDDLRALFDMFDGPDRKLLPVTETDINSMIFTLLTTFPDTAAKMIALASDEPGQEATASKLPAPLQIKIMIEIVKQTFEDVGGPLAFRDLVRGTIAQLAPEITANMDLSNFTGIFGRA